MYNFGCHLINEKEFEKCFFASFKNAVKLLGAKSESYNSSVRWIYLILFYGSS